MKLSTRGRYGARALMELAKHHGQGPLTLKEMAARQEIPLKYLEQIAIVLKHVKIIRGVRGPFGGYVLARSPDKVHLLEIVEALEGPLSFVNCVKDPSACEKVKSCAFNDLWKTVSREASNILRSVSLADMVRMDSQKKGSLLSCLEEDLQTRSSLDKTEADSPQREADGHPLEKVAKGSKSSRTHHL